jgi:arsenate reductase
MSESASAVRQARFTFYHYPKCSTCRKARAALDARGLEYDAVDLVAAPPSADTLEELVGRAGLPIKRWFNTSGESYRAGSFGSRLPSMSDDEAIAALSADGKLIKRPILVGPDGVLVGFDDAAYAALR